MQLTISRCCDLVWEVISISPCDARLQNWHSIADAAHSRPQPEQNRRASTMSGATSGAASGAGLIAISAAAWGHSDPSHIGFSRGLSVPIPASLPLEAHKLAVLESGLNCPDQNGDDDDLHDDPPK